MADADGQLRVLNLLTMVLAPAALAGGWLAWLPLDPPAAADPPSWLTRPVLAVTAATVVTSFWPVRTMLLLRLLEADRHVLGLLRRSPFPDRPPAAVRVLRYRYQFTTPAQRRQTGEWWTRRRVGEPVRRSSCATTASSCVRTCRLRSWLNVRRTVQPSNATSGSWPS